MSANNVVWLMSYKGFWHVFYSGCIDNTPKEPDYKDKYWAKFVSKNQASLYASTVVWGINKECYEQGFSGVEYGLCEVPCIDPEIEETFERIKPALDALYIASKTVTNKDIQDFVSRVEEMVNRLQAELITKENRIKERLCILEGRFICKADHYDMDKIADHVTKGDHKDYSWEGVKKELDKKPREPLVMPEALKAIMKDDVRRYIKNTYIDGVNDGIKREKATRPKSKMEFPPRDDGCYQFTYCNECLAYPMGLGCPNLTKGPVQLKDEIKDGKISNST